MWICGAGVAMVVIGTGALWWSVSAGRGGLRHGAALPDLARRGRHHAHPPGAVRAIGIFTASGATSATPSGALGLRPCRQPDGRGRGPPSSSSLILVCSSSGAVLFLARRGNPPAHQPCQSGGGGGPQMPDTLTLATWRACHPAWPCLARTSCGRPSGLPGRRLALAAGLRACGLGRLGGGYPEPSPHWPGWWSASPLARAAQQSFWG